MEKISKKYGLFQAISLSFGIVIGVGIYFKTPEILGIVQGNPSIGLWAWLAGAMFTIFGGLTIAEYAGTVTETGGMLSYIQSAAGDLAAFMRGWGGILISTPSLIAVLAWMPAKYLTQLLNISTDTYRLPIAVAFVVILFLVNIYKPKSGGKLQGYMTILKIIPLLVIIVFGLFFSDGSYAMEALTKPVVLPEGTTYFSVFLACLIPVIFSFSGWDFAASVSGEVEKPEKNVPKAIIISLIAVSVVYVTIYIAFLNTMPLDGLQEAIPFGVTTRLFGDFASKFIMIAIIISALGALNGVIIGGMRNAYALAIKDNFILPEYFSKVDEKLDIPLRSGILIGVFAFIHLYLMSKGQDFSSIGVVINLCFNILVYGGLIIWHKNGKLNKEGYHTPCFPVIPILAIITTVITVVGLFMVDESTTRSTIISIGFYLLSVPVYYFMKKNQKNKKDKQAA